MKNFSFNSCSSSSLRIFLCTFLLFSILLTSTCPVQSTSTTAISVSPSTVTVNAGKNFSINVTISNVSDLYAWQFALSWNTSLLNLVNATEGPFLKSGGSNTYFNYNLNATAGNLIADCTLLGNVPGVSGSGVLATTTFYVKNGGQCPLNLFDVELYNSLEQNITFQATNGYGYFVSPPNIAVTNLSISPLIVLPGAIVNINVTVENQASVSETFNVTLYANSGIIGKKPVSLNSTSSKIIPFTWNTTGLGEGDYTISASASTVPGEVNIGDNNRTGDNPVTLLYNGHDVAVISVEPLKTAVGQGYCMFIAVTVKNYGIFSETFNTTSYINTTAIQTQNAKLGSGYSSKLIFTWNTTGFAYGKYTISAYAWPVTGESNLANNNCTGGTVRVTIPGDANGDGTVDAQDFFILEHAWGTSTGQPAYDPRADFDNDGTVDAQDFFIMQRHWGLSVP